MYPVFTGRETFSRTRQLTSETGRGFYTMEKYKASICALLVTTSVFSYSRIIVASADKANKISEIPEKAMLVKADYNELDDLLVKEKEVARLAAAKKSEEAAIAAKKAEEAKIAAAKKAEADKIAAAKKAEEAKKAAAKKAEAAKLAAEKANSTKKLVASRGTTTTAVSQEKAKEIIDYAKQFMGVKYVFGGASPSGFDCSGFTMYVFGKFGISLPHSAKSQAELGSAVSRNELIPGDLVFFETYKSGISHVGIYIGSGNFIEASSSRGIAITSLSSSYYKSRYLGATRILK